MALSDLYVASSGSQSISVTTVDQPILLATTPSTKRISITGIRFSIGATSAGGGQLSPAAGGTLDWGSPDPVTFYLGVYPGTTGLTLSIYGLHSGLRDLVASCDLAP